MRRGGPKAYQTKQLKSMEKKRTESSDALTKSRKSSKSGQHSGSSTKSPFYSPLTGILLSPSESVNNNSTIDTKETAEEVNLSENGAFNEITKTKASEDKIDPDCGDMATTLTTGDLIIVVEDHSPFLPSSDAKIYQFDNLDSGTMDILRRPSKAELITQLQPTSPQ